jgi:hypothetical protein
VLVGVQVRVRVLVVVVLLLRSDQREQPFHLLLIMLHRRPSQLADQSEPDPKHKVE